MSPHRLTALAFVVLVPACGGDTHSAAKTDQDASTIKNEVADSGGSPGNGTPLCSPSGYDGDDLCIPASGNGIHIHYGPKSYSAEDTKPFVLQPKGEEVDCLNVITPNAAEFDFAEYHVHMRGDSPWILANAESSLPSDPTVCAATGQLVLGSTGQKTDVVLDAPENAGPAEKLPPHAGLAIQLHFLNDSDKPILREAWIDLEPKNPKTVNGGVGLIELIGGLTMSVPPQTTRTLQFTASAPQDMSVLGLAPYFQAHTKRLSAWKVAGGTSTKLLDVYDYKSLTPIYFDSTHQNPALGSDAGVAGSVSGPVTLSSGDQIKWECEIDNDLDTPIGFGQSTHTAEMCILFGFYTPSDGRTWEATQ